MKKIILLIVTAITLMGCSNNDLESKNEENKSNNNDELIVEEKDLKENNNEKKVSNFEKMLKEFLVDSYEKSSFTDFRHTESILSEELLNKMYEAQQSSEVHFDEEERIVREFELFSSKDNPNRYIYIVTLEIDKAQTEHYGEVITINESGEQKINDLREINMNEL